MNESSNEIKHYKLMVSEDMLGNAERILDDANDIQYIYHDSDLWYSNGESIEVHYLFFSVRSAVQKPILESIRSALVKEGMYHKDISFEEIES